MSDPISASLKGDEYFPRRPSSYDPDIDLSEEDEEDERGKEAVVITTGQILAIHQQRVLMLKAVHAPRDCAQQPTLITLAFEKRVCSECNKQWPCHTRQILNGSFDE